MELEALIGKLRARLAGSGPELVAAWLYGSVARGTARHDSDVDLALLYRSPLGPELDTPASRLEVSLEEELGREVQVLVANSAPPDLLHRVLRDGVLLLDRDRRARILFEVRTRKEFFDMQPIFELYRRSRPAG